LYPNSYEIVFIKVNKAEQQCRVEFLKAGGSKVKFRHSKTFADETSQIDVIFACYLLVFGHF
jgi:hypothetical protein